MSYSAKTYVAAIEAVIPGIDKYAADDIARTLDKAEMALSSIVDEAQRARDALRSAKIAGNAGRTEDANRFLGVALYMASLAGYSGTISSHTEVAMVNLAIAHADIRKAAAITSLLAAKAEA